MKPWLATLAAALRGELDAQRSELARLRALPPDERLAQGAAWPVLATESPRPAGPWLVLTLRPCEGGALHDGIGPGERVTLRVLGQEGELEGRVREVYGAAAEVAVARPRGAPPDWTDGGRVEVVRAFDGHTLQALRDSLARVPDSPLARVLLGEEAAATVPADVPPDPGLNPAQQAARALALGAAPLALVHGPPGTGKTRLLASVLVALRDRGDRPWALADSNAAVDNLALAAAARGLRVLRVGAPWRLSAAVRHLSLDHAMATGPLADALAALERDLRRAWDQGDWRTGRSLQRELRALRDQARALALGSAEVLALTFGSLVGRADQLPPATCAVVDEATQAIEPAIWAAVPHVEKLVLVGDPEQLGPVVIGRSPVLETSLLQRLVAAPAPPPMATLVEQHRMLPAIQALVAGVYGPAYTAHPSATDPALPGGGTVDFAPVRWIDTAGAGMEEAVDPASRSTHNPGEARLVAQVVAALVAAAVPPDAVGVITPYSAQVQRLRRVLPPAVEVASVNAFQGREKACIVVSFVRSNADGAVGFVADPRRLTVALTRARVLLVLIGDSATLSTVPRFAALLDAVAAAGQLDSVWAPPWDAALDG